jgi:hypothetical protein
MVRMISRMVVPPIHGYRSRAWVGNESWSMFWMADSDNSDDCAVSWGDSANPAWHAKSSESWSRVSRPGVVHGRSFGRRRRDPEVIAGDVTHIASERRR